MVFTGRKKVMHVEPDLPASVQVCVYLLGPLELAKRDSSGTWKLVSKDRWKNSKPARSVFKRLLVQPGRRLSRCTLEDDLWPQTADFELATKSVYNAISLIRALIGKPLLTCWEAAYELAYQTLLWTDLDGCALLLTEAENHGAVSLQALPFLERALRLLERGELVEGEEGQWCYAFRKRAEDMLKQCRLWLAEHYQTQGQCWQAAEQYRALCQTLPPDEQALERWMAMLYQQGHIQDALQCYRDTKAYAQAQEWALSPALDSLAARLEEHQASASRLVESFLLPETAVSLWRPDPASPEIARRFTACGALLQAHREQDAQQAGVCDILELEIAALTLRWKRSSGPISLLQQLTSEIMRKHDTMHADLSDPDSRRARRRALQAIALFPIQVYGLTRFADNLPPRLPLDELLACCASGLVACWELRQYEPEGLVLIERLLPAYLATLEQLACHSSPVQAEAARLAAQGYLLLTVLASHARRLEQMEAASVLARSYGQLAQDANLEVAALIRLGVKFGFEHRMVEAFSTYQQAAALPGFAMASPLSQGHVYAALAGTGAFFQHPEALSYLSHAKDVYPTAPESDPSFVFDLCGKDILPFWEGLMLKRLGHYAEALTAFSRFGSLTPVAGVLDYHRAEHLNYAASVAVEQRDLQTVCLYLDAAEEVAWNVHNQQRQAEVRETFREVQLLWPYEPQVKMLQEKLSARQHE
jgi:DNA-binding SARP family transcriptional activator